MNLPAEHIHDHASPRGSCSVCYAWALVAISWVMRNPHYNVVTHAELDARRDEGRERRRKERNARAAMRWG